MGTYLCIFLHIFMYIYTYFHVYFYLFLHISTYLHIFSAIFMYISTYFHVYFYLFLHIYHKSVAFLPQIATKVCCFTTDCHKSLLFYYRLPQKCVVLLQFDTKVWARNVTQNGAQTNYVPQAPHMGHSWGTEYSRAQDGKYLIFLKNLSTLL